VYSGGQPSAKNGSAGKPGCNARFFAFTTVLLKFQYSKCTNMDFSQKI